MYDDLVNTIEIKDELKLFDNDFINHLTQEAGNQIDYWDIRATISNGTTIDFTDQKSTEISSYEITNCGIRTFVL
jgi:predicted Zn-dependent protease